MRERIIRGLAPVRRRQLGQGVARAAMVGLLPSSLVGIGLGRWRWQTASWVSPALAWPILLSGPLLGASGPKTPAGSWYR